MLTTSSSQYLQPEYIQPLPSTLDVNNSPLALLAQTCSSIGKDPGPSSSKSISGSASDKKSSHTSSSSSGAKESSSSRAKSESPSGKNSSISEERSKSRPSGGGGDKKDSSGGAGQRSSGSKGTPPKTGFRVPPAPPKDGSSGSDRLNPDSASGGSSSSESGRNSRDGGQSTTTLQSNTGGRTMGGSSSGGGGGKPPPGSGNTCSNMLLELNQEALNKSSLHHGSMHPLYSSLKDSLQALHGSLGPSLGGCTLPFLGYPLSLDPLAAYSASLAAHCNSLAGISSSQKSPATPCVSTTPCSAAASLSPYVSYARVKTASGGTTLVQVCKDPYCTNCQVALHGAQMGAQAPCTGPGCSQCAQHDKTSPTSLASPVPTGIPFYPGVPTVAGGGGGGLPSLCSHAAFTSASGLAGSPHGGPLVTPYVCNWVQGNEYCGKRFASSEELLQHLRSHTSTAEAALVSPFNAAAAAGIPLSALGFPLGGLFGCPSLSPGLLSPTSYPRSLSPNTLLAAARYHPYKHPSLSMLPGSTTPIFSGAFPSLAAYYSPYAFYGQRLGAAAAAGP